MLYWFIERLKKFANLLTHLNNNKNAFIQEPKQTGKAQNNKVHKGEFRHQLRGAGGRSLPLEGDNHDYKREPLQEGDGEPDGVPFWYLSEGIDMELSLPKNYKAKSLTPIVLPGMPETMYWVYDSETGTSRQYTEATNEETISWVCKLHGSATLNTPEMYTLLIVRATALDLAIIHKVAVWSNLLGGHSLEDDDFLVRDKKIRGKKDGKEKKK